MSTARKQRAKPRAVGMRRRLVRYDVTFTLTVEKVDDGDPRDDELLVEEAVTALVDEELAAHVGGGTRCGAKFVDATIFETRFVDATEVA
jgi:hypothetical protein